MMGRLYLQHLRRILPLKQMALLFLLTIFAFTAGAAAYGAANREIAVRDGETLVVAKTLGNDVQQALAQLDVEVGEQDFVSMPLRQLLGTDGTNLLTIKRAVPMTLTVDGETRDILSWRDTVGEVLSDQQVSLSAMDRIEGMTAKTPVEAGLAVRVVRVRTEAIKEFAAIPYDVVEQQDKNLNEGETLVAQVGVDGRSESVYHIVYEDNKPVSRTFLYERTVSEPVNRLVMLGTVKNFTNHRGDLVRYAKIMDMKATAYTASYADTGKHPGDPAFGITRSGLRAREGVIAVDPRVIPLGTKVYVESPGAAPDYGFAIAADIGSAIKGNLIDLYFDTTQQALNWGRRSVRVYILNEQNDARWKENDDPCTK